MYSLDLVAWTLFFFKPYFLYIWAVSIEIVGCVNEGTMILLQHWSPLILSFMHMIDFNLELYAFRRTSFKKNSHAVLCQEGVKHTIVHGCGGVAVAIASAPSAEMNVEALPSRTGLNPIREIYLSSIV